MKYEIDIPETLLVKSGKRYVPTGEMRVPLNGEIILTNGGIMVAGPGTGNFPRIILREAEPEYPCSKCGKLRTKAEGGATFTVCEACWEKQPTPEEIESATHDVMENIKRLQQEASREPKNPADFARVELVRDGVRHCVTDSFVDSLQGGGVRIMLYLRPVAPPFVWPAEWSEWDSLTCDYDTKAVRLYQETPEMGHGEWHAPGLYMHADLIRVAYPHIRLPEMKPGERIVNPNRKESDREP